MKQSSAAAPAAPVDAAHRPLPWWQVAGYGAGDAANNVAFTTTTMFLLVYYTDVAGISAAAAGTLLLVVRIFDAFADVFAGRVVDGARVTRWGKFRPFILFGSVPLLILAFLCFHVPAIGQSGMLIYAYLTYAALGLAYSLVNIPYGSMAAAMTQTGSDRAKLGAARVVGATLVGAGLGTFVSPLLKTGADLQGIFTTVLLVLMVIGFVLYLVCFATARERVQRPVARVSMRDSLRAVGQNKPLLLLMASSLLFLSAFLALNTVQLYYIRDVLRSPALFPVLSLAQLVLTFVFVALMPMLVRRLGKKRLYLIFGGFVVLGGLIIWLTPSSVPALGFTGLVVATLGTLGNNVVVFALEADTVEYGEWKTGVRSEGSIYAVFSFTRKCGQAIGGGIAGWGLSLGGYVAGSATQSDQALGGIQTSAGLVPAVLALLAVLVMLAYPLTEKVHGGLVEEIRIRRETGRIPVVLEQELERETHSRPDRQTPPDEPAR
ncbi:glucuronide transporter [Tersicoccus solisilvae]|uniref:Glucuronide transporter n=1 Tax=Tersicoccus solisilvae TaxID=1882339 RepID=A0ABQ1P8T6_9MICC|nr:glucuronide transporter [Tersicoccus solisilvae]GGC93367.1 glucuronide transporter [Tersicoccus solisilvae]